MFKSLMALKTSWTSLFKFLEKFVIVYRTIDFISEIIDMFGFIGKFKTEVLAGFEAIHQRLVTLEAQVGALFNHTAVVAKVEAAVDAATLPPVVEAAADAVEAAVAPAAASNGAE